MLHQSSYRGLRFLMVCVFLGLIIGPLAQAPLSAGLPGKKPKKQKPNLEDKMRVLSKGSSSNAAQEKGLAELPLEKLSETQRAKASQVVSSLSLFRELPTLAFEVDPIVHHYFLDHPDVAVSIWRAMKISKFQMTETAAGIFSASDNEGTTGGMEVLYRDQHQALVLCDGVVQSPLLPTTIKAQTLLHLQWDFVKSPEGKFWSRNRLRMYVAFPSQAIEAAAKVVSPLGNMIIDRNLREVSLFVAMMSMAMVHQPGWVEHTARQLEGVSVQRQDELIQLTARVYVAARKRILAKKHAEGEVSLDEIIRPLAKAKESPGPGRSSVP